MGIAGLKTGAIIAGVAIGGGALAGGAIGAVRSLNGEAHPASDGFTTAEKRSTLANVIIGAGVGALGGAALVGAKKVFTINALKNVPLPVMLALGTGAGAASFGAYAVGRNVFN